MAKIGCPSCGQSGDTTELVADMRTSELGKQRCPNCKNVVVDIPPLSAAIKVGVPTVRKTGRPPTWWS